MKILHEQNVVHIKHEQLDLEGELTIPREAKGLVLFAHGSGSSRHSPRNKFVAERLQSAGLGTLLMDLLTPEEEVKDAYTAGYRFDIPLLTTRVELATDWVRNQRETNKLRIGYFGASTGAAAALIAAAENPGNVAAIVSRGGRPDLAGESLALVRAPTLLIVGGNDLEVLRLNSQSLHEMEGDHELLVIRGASHLFEELGALDEVAEHAAEWFVRFLGNHPAKTRSSSERIHYR